MFRDQSVDQSDKAGGDAQSPNKPTCGDVVGDEFGAYFM